MLRIQLQMHLHRFEFWEEIRQSTLEKFEQVSMKLFSFFGHSVHTIVAKHLQQWLS